MDWQWYLVMVGVLCSVGVSQRTYMRACECEYTVNGKCAYTLLLPVAKGTQGGSGSCPTHGSPQAVTDASKSSQQQKNIEELQRNISKLSTWSGEQTRLLTQLQSTLISQQTTIQSVLSQQAALTNLSHTISSRCQVCNNIDKKYSEQDKLIKNLQQTLSSQQDAINKLQGLVPSFTASVQQVQETLARLGNNTQGLQGKMTILQSTVSSWKTNYKLCQKRGLLVTGPVSNLPDASITASSVLDSQYSATRGRINAKNSTSEGSLAGAWCPGEPNKKYEWLQFDLGQPKVIYGIVTRGRSDYDQWVTSYKVQYTSGNPTSPTAWTTYTDVIGDEQMFTGNSDQSTPKVNMLLDPITARYIRILPLKANIIGDKPRNKCLRADVIGCLD